MQLSNNYNDFLYYGVTEGSKSGYAPHRTFAICGRLVSLKKHLISYLYLTIMLKFIIFHLGFGS